jgi:hypothetical protein
VPKNVILYNICNPTPQKLSDIGFWSFKRILFSVKSISSWIVIEVRDLVENCISPWWSGTDQLSCSWEHVFTSLQVPNLLHFKYVYKSSCCPLNRPWRPIGLRNVKAPTFSGQSAHRWQWGCQPYPPAALYTPGRFLVLISVTGWVDPRAIVQLQGLGLLKNPVTSSGYEPTTFWLTAQCLNQLCYRVPSKYVYNINKNILKEMSHANL